ncbi:hypothetical protein [Seonamhaeicola marinus]|nr:hypothetical protein [Seonamhaeicola marinus]
MKKFVLIFCLLPGFMLSQNMTNEKLQEIYTEVSDSIVGNLGSWQFYIKKVPIVCITDSTHNRMRIISPIADSETLNNELIRACLVANFHTALDVKYAVSEGVLWSVFIHPLKELSEHQVKDAVSQVYQANLNFGTTFSSTSLTFPGRKNDKREVEKEKKKPKLRKL